MLEAEGCYGMISCSPSSVIIIMTSVFIIHREKREAL
jgi:hypothetical protein